MGLAEEILNEMRKCEPYTARELAEATGAHRRTVDRRLRELEEDGVVRRKKHSRRRVSWWIAPETNLSIKGGR